MFSHDFLQLGFKGVVYHFFEIFQSLKIDEFRLILSVQKTNSKDTMKKHIVNVDMYTLSNDFPGSPRPNKEWFLDIPTTMGQILVLGFAISFQVCFFCTVSVLLCFSSVEALFDELLSGRDTCTQPHQGETPEQ